MKSLGDGSGVSRHHHDGAVAGPSTTTGANFIDTRNELMTLLEQVVFALEGGGHRPTESASHPPIVVKPS